MDELLNALVQTRTDEDREERKEFANNCSTDRSRMAYMLKFFERYEFQRFSHHKAKVKNQTDSEKFKSEGNKIVVLKRDAEEYLQALMLYNKCISFAPNNSKELALGFANRSAVLFHFQKYSEAVQDIDRALDLNYPAHLKHKLLLRKTECLALLGSSELNKVYETTLKLLNEMTLDAASKETLKNKLTSIGKVTQQKIDNLGLDVPEIQTQHAIPCATDAVALRYDNEFGRHLVATREIKPGEILAITKPYSMTVNINKMYTHCAHCLTFLWAGIPCDNCVYVLYCSKKCKDLAWKEYHDVECPLIGELLNEDLKMSHILCMRILILSVREFGSIEQLKEELRKIDESKTDPRAKGFTENGQFDGSSYRSVYNLVTNTEKRSTEDLFKMAYNCALILIAMAVYTTFLGKFFKNNEYAALSANEDVMFIGGLLLRNYQIIINNAHEYPIQRILDYEDRGTTIVPFFSLINHDCNPNVCREVSKGRMLLCALLPIKKDEQIFDNYAGTYTSTPREYRQFILKRHYYFTCKCTACERKWPLSPLLSTYDINLIKSSVQRKRIKEVLEKLEDYCDSKLWDLTVKPSARLAYIKSQPNILKDVRNMIFVLMRSLPVNSLPVVRAVITLRQIVDAYNDQFEVPELKNM